MLDVREIHDRELDRWVELRRVVTPTGTPADMRDWRRQAEDMCWLVAELEGVDAGTGLGIVGWHAAPGVGTGVASVLPDRQSHGVGTALYRELARWLSERGCIEMETSVAEDDAMSLGWAERRGFREVGRHSLLVLDLTGVEEPILDPPAGIDVVSWAERRDLARAMYDVYCEAEPDIPGEEHAVTPSFEQWLEHDMEGHSDRPECVFVALAGDEVVGYAKLSLSSAREGVAMHDITGVKRAWRRRGIAGALKRAEIAWAKHHGFTRLETQNEARNEPIRRLNERHGYRVAPGTITLRAALLGPE